MKRLAILGAGGQAKETEWLVRQSGHSAVAFLVRNAQEVTSPDEKIKDESWLDTHIPEIDGIVLGVGDPRTRLRIAAHICARFPQLPWPSLIDPTAIVDRASLRMGKGVAVGPGAIITVNVSLDDFVMINFGATIGHDVEIGAGTVVNPGANVSGGVVIGNGALIGAGAAVLQCLSIGQFATVGAGAVATKNVIDHATVKGVPARG